MAGRRAWRVAWLVVASSAVGVAPALATPKPPGGPHPRIALDATALRALKARAADSSSATADAIAACRRASPEPGDTSGYQGDAWAFPASACALAWQLTRDPALAARGIKLWRALLEDVARLGDGKACVPGAPPEKAIAAIQRDTGYAIRFIAPHAALAYDWLHDAPGVTEAFRKQSRACFGAWLDWYGTKGYLRDEPGGNYHAGFVLAKTLIAVAEAGEDGATSDRYWKEAVDDLFGAQIVGNGLAARRDGVPGGRMNGALLGGDWPEGWQYGTLSVVEYALAARVLEDHGVRLPETHAWADDLTVRFLHGLTPDRKGMYIGGDTEEEGSELPPSSGPLLATLLGPSSARAAGWAASLRAQLGIRRYGPPVFDALAEARAITPSNPLAVPGGRPRWFLARGTRNLYVRSGWDAAAAWAVFTSAPRLVADHQHLDASDFVLSRGADPLVVDPTPYGSRSTLTGNALSVETDVVKDRYAPSQTPWGAAELPWARAGVSGIAAARADVGPAFAFPETESDVPLARRDWVFLPEGEVVVVDRVVTGGSRRAVYLRFRTPGPLTGVALAKGSPEAFLARANSGASTLFIHAVTLRPPAPPSMTVRPKKSECDERGFGACTAARFTVGEYAVKLTGPEVLAVHVLDGLGKGEAPASVKALGGPGSADAVVGVAVTRRGETTYVVGDSAASATPAQGLTYRVDGKARARHVVFDAPEDAQHRAAVSAVADGGGICLVTIAAKGAHMLAGRPLMFATAPAASGCAVTEDADAPSDGTSGGAPLPSASKPASRAEVTARKVLKRIAALHPRRYLKKAAALGLASVLGLTVLVWLRRRSQVRRRATD